LLIWLFGEVQESLVHISSSSRISGYLGLKNANVQWMLSIDKEDIPIKEINKGKTTFRSITIDGAEIEFSDGFTDLHTRVYEETLAGKGFGIDEARPSIKIVHEIRNSKISNDKDCIHPLVSKLLGKK
jgi:UDP-N-acetyl-2-amino-2-deoxyglucuronate dehydrogenase